MVIEKPPSIVVGIDGSGESAAALRWALREGSARKIPVEVVHCWQRHSLKDLESGLPREVSRGSVGILEAETTAELSAIDSGPELVRSSVHGRPAQVLLHRTENAVLLVIGAHSHLANRHAGRGQVADMCIQVGLLPGCRRRRRQHCDLLRREPGQGHQLSDGG